MVTGSFADTSVPIPLHTQQGECQPSPACKAIAVNSAEKQPTANEVLLFKFYSNLLHIAIGSVQGYIGSLIILALIFGGNANSVFNFLMLQFPHHKDGRDLPLIKHPESNQWEGSQRWIMGSLIGFFL